MHSDRAIMFRIALFRWGIENECNVDNVHSISYFIFGLVALEDGEYCTPVRWLRWERNEDEADNPRAS